MPLSGKKLINIYARPRIIGFSIHRPYVLFFDLILTGRRNCWSPRQMFRLYGIISLQKVCISSHMPFCRDMTVTCVSSEYKLRVIHDLCCDSRSP